MSDAKKHEPGSVEEAAEQWVQDIANLALRNFRGAETPLRPERLLGLVTHTEAYGLQSGLELRSRLEDDPTFRLQGDAEGVKIHTGYMAIEWTPERALDAFLTGLTPWPQTEMDVRSKTAELIAGLRAFISGPGGTTFVGGICGLSLQDVESVDLGAGVFVQLLTDDLARRLGMDERIPTTFPRRLQVTSAITMAGTPVPVEVGPVSETQFTAFRRELEERRTIAADALLALNLALGPCVLESWALTHDGWPGGNAYASHPLGQMWPRGTVLKPDSLPELQTIFGWLRSMTGRKDNGLKVSLRRFVDASLRQRLDDRIVDLMISAEALFLSEVAPGDRGEMRYRLGVRAAMYLETDPVERRKVRDVFKTAYDRRSEVVHRSSSMKPEDGELLTDTREYLRRALRTAIASRAGDPGSSSFADWDTLIFGPLEGSAPKEREPG